MCDAVGGDVRSGHGNSSEGFEDINEEDPMPAYEEITTMKTEVIEECYDCGTLDGVEPGNVRPFSPSEDFQSVTGGDPVTSPYEQILKNDHYEQHIVWCKEGNDFRLSEEAVAARDDRKYICDKYSYFIKNKSKVEKPFKCGTCGRSFRRKTDLMKHIKTHDNHRRKRVPCPYCNKTYYANYAVQCHIDVKHTHKKYKCLLCDYATGYKYVLKQHEQIKHGNGDKLYKCRYCEHSTHYKRNMENHERTHSNALLKCTYKNCICEQQRVSSKERSCRCDPCQFETAYGSSLRDHIKVKHSVKAERHTCTVCSYSTHFKRYLRKHMDTHANKESQVKYKCDYCDHTTRWKGNLKKHTLIHTNEKIFKCTYMSCNCDCVGEKPCDCKACGYQSVNARDLKIHILIKHSGEAKKYTCTFCDYSSHIKGHLKRHLLCIHAKVKSVPSENSRQGDDINGTYCINETSYKLIPTNTLFSRI